MVNRVAVAGWRAKIFGAIDPTRRAATRSPPRIWVVVTCMGRLAFLKQTAPTLLAEPELNYCLVDYSCPDGAGPWFQSQFAGEIARGRALVVTIPNRSFFEKSKAQNAGGNEVLQRGADYICFLDGDTLARPGLGAWLAQHLQHNRFVIAGALSSGYDVHCLTGLMAMPSAEFAACGGYDEGMLGWGGEDIEMRFKMHIKQGLRYSRIPIEFLDYIEHGDELRVKNHIISMTESNARNLTRAHQHVLDWTGHDIFELGSDARRLVWWHPDSNGPIDGAEVWRVDVRVRLGPLFERARPPSRPSYVPPLELPFEQRQESSATHRETQSNRDLCP